MGPYLLWIVVAAAGVGYWKLLVKILGKRAVRGVLLWLPPSMSALGLLTTAAYELAFSLFGTAWKGPVDLLLLAIWLVNYPAFAVTLLLWGSPADQLLGWGNAALAAAEFWAAWLGALWLAGLGGSEEAVSIRP